MPKKLCIAAIIIALLLSLLLTGCNSTTDNVGPAPVVSETAQTLKVFRVNLTSNPSTLDPALATSESELLLVRALFDTLVDFRNGEIQPALAESWTYSENGRLLTIRLQDGLKFSNGRLLTAADVEFSLERILDGSVASPYGSLLSASIGGRDAVINSIQAIDTSTIIISFPSPRRDFIELLAHPCFSVVCKDEVLKNQTGEGTYFSGTAFPVSGPLKMVEWIDNRSITLEPNKHYYAKNAGFDRLELVIDRSEEITMYDFGAHNLDMVFLQAADLEKMGMKYPYITKQIDFGSPLVTYFLSLNPQTQLLKNFEIRQAVVSAIDQDQIMEASEVFEVTESPLGRLSRGTGLYIGNPRMLFESVAPGAGSKQVLTLSYPPGEVSYSIADNLKKQLESSLGITVNLKETAAPKPYLYDQSAHLSLIRWVVPTPAKSAFFSYFYGEGVNPFINGNAVGEAGQNYFKQAGTLESAADRDQYYTLISEELSRTFLVCGLVNVKTLYALQEKTTIPAGLEDVLGIYNKEVSS